ncbi:MULTISPECIES: efflux RND transporter periplasmic adaptor subunit [Ramlibacter]|uniref:Efflux RND transporter periplasmic adaptor subunit n=1 Tax=Ramlibacter pinisoli TaxID=2682844 RepID=A0A6N8IPJ8_9BURK|nr:MULTISPECIES: efflux RND transporter periplasmic adaptor subunit [Ramlibacter]MBA2963106.1 efflux RND transporter periplasmic adaptor subunit [Ramlibacter sp. CGMCC 1.13660]MVQ28076.1 efflux RND transporter periplasmic adaptor subunit [Ramlibacter pinisoli]
MTEDTTLPAGGPPPRQVQRWTRIVTATLLVLLALGAARTLVSRNSNAKALDKIAADSSVQYVRTTTVRAAGTGQNLSLPGTLQGFVQAPVSARAGGYLRRWTKDIGSRVEQGDLLAEIETPELDQQLSQAVAARNQAAASLELARTTVERWEALRQRDAVSQQELEERRSAFTQSKANLAGADANVERLKQLGGFKRVVAPFAGVITKRNVDIGDLIDSNRPLFLLSQTDPLRVYVNVPQAYAHLVKPGQKATVVQAELRGRNFTGQVARTAGSIDTASRTMQVEVAIPNKDGALLPGAFVQVQLAAAASGTPTIPANALLMRGQGVLVARVDAVGTVQLVPVRLGRNFGDAVEVLDGLSGNETLVLNPSDSLAAGDKVQVVADARASVASAPKAP